MKRFYILIVALIIVNVSRAQFPVNPDSVYTFIKHNSVWKNNIKNWKPVDSVFKKQLKAAKTDIDTIRCFIPVFEKLNDVHSYFIYNNKYYNYYVPVDSFTLQKIQPTLNKSRELSGKIATARVSNGYIYVRVPAMNAFGEAAINQAAQSLYDSLIQYESEKPKGFIIDLRLNSGGNMYPMLAGLSPVFGNGFLAFELDADDKLVRKWSIRDGDLAINDNKVTSIKQPFKAAFEKLPVVVLTGPVTASSGSMVAIAFKHRPNTALIGENTADGYTTSNGYFQYAPNLTFMFATSFVADRSAKVHKNAVPADLVIFRDDNFDNPAMDEKVQTAIKWMDNR